MARRKNDKSIKTPTAKRKIRKVMEEFSEGELRSGSKKGPKVTSRKQAVAIALSEARRKGEKARKAKKK